MSSTSIIRASLHTSSASHPVFRFYRCALPATMILCFLGGPQEIEQWFFQTDGYGFVFIMNAPSRPEAHVRSPAMTVFSTLSLNGAPS